MGSALGWKGLKFNCRKGHILDESDVNGVWYAVKRIARLKARAAKLENALEEIERRGHRGGYHGRGYSLADIAEAALQEG